MSPICHPRSPKMIRSVFYGDKKIAKTKHSVYDLNWWGAMLRSLQGEGRSDNARFTGLQTTRPPAAAACTSHICGLWVLLLSQLYSLWVLFFKDVYSLTTVQFRCSRVDSQTLEGKSPLHWMADLPHHPFSGVTLIKSALRCLPLLLFSSSSSSSAPPSICSDSTRLAVT